MGTSVSPCLADSLCSNLSVLSASVASLLASGAGDAAESADAVAAHREALKAYATLIYWLTVAADTVERCRLNR
jgi:condensin complex subunit 1